MDPALEPNFMLNIKALHSFKKFAAVRLFPTHWLHDKQTQQHNYASSHLTVR